MATITLESPPANALSTAVIDGLGTAIDAAVAAEVGALVVRSALPGFFAAGADLKLLGSTDADGFAAYLTVLRGVLERIAALPIVSIAAIDGHALGGGLELAMACTLRVGGPGVRLGVPEVRLGLLPGAGGTQRLPRLVGRGPALDLLLTGRSLTAEEARSLGLLSRLVDDADATAGSLAAELAAGPRQAHAAIIRCVAASELAPEEGMRIESEEVTALFGSPDGREGVAAFLAKRRPVFGDRG